MTKDTPRDPGQDVIIGPSASGRSEERRERLSRIGRLLTGFEDVVTTVTAVVEEARLIVPLRSLVLIELVEQQTVTSLWYEATVPESRRVELVEDAKRRLQYLTPSSAGPSGLDIGDSPSGDSIALSSGNGAAAVEGPPRLIALPLVPVPFQVTGVVLFELITDDPTGEDLVFAAAIVNHLAVALDAFRSRSKVIALAAQIKEAQQTRAMATLVGGVAHHFNNQLTVILANAELAQMELGGASELTEMFTDIRGAGARLVALTKQLLAIGRNQRTLRKRLSVNDFVTAMSDQLAEIVGGSKGGLELALGKDLWLVDIDATQLEVVITALVVNAHEAGRETHSVRVATANATGGSDCTPGEFVALSVRDHGIGMDRATRARMFEPFFSTKDPGLVAGLGLAVVEGIVAMNGGHIGVATDPGQGTTVTVFLPAVFPATP